MEDKGFFSKVVMQTHHGACPLSPVIKVALFILVQERGDIYATVTKGNLRPAFGQLRGGQRTLPAFVDSQFPSSQNRVSYFGVAYSEPLKGVPKEARPYIQRAE